LRGLSFAGQSLHPEVVNLEILLHAIESGTLSADVLSLWRKRLEEELAAGRLRSEFVYLFGALLEEWTGEVPADERLRQQGRQARDRLLEAALREPALNRHTDVLDPLFDELGPALTDLGERLRQKCRENLCVPVRKNELADVLSGISGNIYQAPWLRREARCFAANDLLCKELSDALTILLAELHTWNWPAEGLGVRVLWTRNKWRLYLDEDLPTACLLELLGERWIAIFDHLIGDSTSRVHERRARLKKLSDLNAPAVIVENERRMLREAEQLMDLGFSEEADPWEENETPPTVSTTPDINSIVQMRAREQRILRSLRVGGDYDGEYDAINRAVVLVHAEIQLTRAAFPDRPLNVVKIDMRDCYGSLPHNVLLTLLSRLGLNEDDRAFFARFLTPPLRDESENVQRMRRGVPMNHTLSGMLAELLLRLLEKHVQRKARVRIVRLVDDVCILAPDGVAAVAAWQAIADFCDACGLSVNEEKSGAVCLGGALPDALPRRLPRWGMLELDERGDWRVHGETFDAHLMQSRERIESASSIFSRVQLYNANLKYLLSSLALSAALGDVHRQATDRAIGQFHQHFFGPGKGIMDGLRATIRERFQVNADVLGGIPESWLYWPITAGGLALKNPLVVAAQYAAAYRLRDRMAIPSVRLPGWNLHANDWSAYYGGLLELVHPIEPSETKVMKTLVNDFIARGKEISGGQQEGLDPYWRWILCTYGPEILQRFGSFRFLIAELVPLQLIGQQLVRDSSLADNEHSTNESSAPREDIPF
jgi:hypothetical protein